MLAFSDIICFVKNFESAPKLTFPICRSRLFVATGGLLHSEHFFICRMSPVLLLLGSNLSSRFVYLQRAIHLLNEAGVSVQQLSPFYETAAWGHTEQNDFLNVAAQVETNLSPQDLLKRVKATEQELGRTTTTKWGPREIDIDILFYGNEILHTETLTVPHPELQQRRFALVPLNDLVPDEIHPVFKKSIAKLLSQCADKSAIRYYCEGDFQSKAITVKGKVQGVAFRHYTLHAAQVYGLKGMVKNRPDGSVYTEAEGSKQSMNAFLNFCRQGSPAARVDELLITDREPTFFNSFEIVR